jgi:hypothetical protein
MMRTIEISVPGNMVIDIEKHERYTYEQLKEFLGTDIIQVVKIPDNIVIQDAILICDEEAKFKSHVDINGPATMILALAGIQDIVAGNAIICNVECYFDKSTF